MRAFTAPPQQDRCKQDITLRNDGSGSQCMRRKAIGDFCKQHAKGTAVTDSPYTRTQFSEFHYPEEWGPSDARRLTCVCGNPDPFHADPPLGKPTDVNACKWETKERSNTFRVKKEDPKEPHSAWFLVLPGNAMLAFNHNEDDKIDEARANWVAYTLNAAMNAAMPEPIGFISDFHDSFRTPEQLAALRISDPDDQRFAESIDTPVYSEEQMRTALAASPSDTSQGVSEATRRAEEAEADSARRHQLLILQHAESVELWNALKDLSFECDGVTRTMAPSRETYNRAFGLLQRKLHLSPEALSGHGNAAGAALRTEPTGEQS